MPGTFQHTLYNAEINPPENAWENISNRLDKEVDAADLKIALLVHDASLNVPPAAWGNIVAELDGDTNSVKQAPVISLLYRRIAAAAVVAGLLIAGVWYFTQSNTTNSLPAVIVGNQPTQTLENNQAKDDFQLNSDEPVLAVAQIIPRKLLVRNNRTVRPVTTTRVAPTTGVVPGEISFVVSNYDEENLPTRPVRHISTIDTKGNVAIAGPPIRDGSGRIILDMNLITSVSGDYVIVTAPNGEQTRISSKFARYLTYLNTSSPESDPYFDFFFNRSSTWKKRFEDWRIKILEQPGFSPSTATFFDIIELKDLIKE
ncbi:MAG: hypothetical protein H7Y31_04655 [Chitinophagaceae bacterium]|nr:hypothetical protein [Chitinophagaceae bacterium]